IGARELVHELLPLAERGLLHAEIDAGECERLLTIIGRRASTGQTGAQWQRSRLAAIEDKLGRKEALACMLGEYLDHAELGAPVHTWPIP
ncbi:MAG: glutamate--cysteine ligase, partial [Gammaproteobacteria bacterium]